MLPSESGETLVPHRMCGGRVIFDFTQIRHHVLAIMRYHGAGIEIYNRIRTVEQVKSVYKTLDRSSESHLYGYTKFGPGWTVWTVWNEAEQGGDDNWSFLSLLTGLPAATGPRPSPMLERAT